MANLVSPPLALSIKDACVMAGFSRAKMYREINAGRMPARKAGGRTLILRADLDEYLTALPISVPAEATS